MFKVWRFVSLALALVMALACSHNPASTRGAKVGVLTCTSVPGTRVNVLITSSVDVECTLGANDRYTGQTGMQLGLDLNWTLNQTFYFSVLTAYSKATPGFLAGRYVGGKVGATIGIGIGVGALVGGGAGNITLEPFGVEISTGVGISGGIAYLNLTPASGS